MSKRGSCLALVAPLVAASIAAAGFQNPLSPDALLRRARESAGADALARVESIAVTVHRDTVRSQYRLRWPDQYQNRTARLGATIESGPESQINANTLDGQAFWQKFPNPVPPENASRARRGIVSRFVNTSMIYLLRTPPKLKVTLKSLGRVTMGGLSGDALLLSDPMGRHAVYVFDPGTGAIKGYVDHTTAEGGMRGPTAHLIVRFPDVRTVAGIKFPFRIEEQWDAAPGEAPRATVTVVDAIEVNTLSAEHFKQAGR